MLWLTDAERGLSEFSGPALRIGALGEDVGTLLAVDTARRTAQVLGWRVTVIGVPDGWDDLNIHPAGASGDADVLLRRPAELTAPPYRLAHRLAWLSGDSLESADAELALWRSLVASWAEAPSKPMCAGVKDDLLAALVDDLRTRDAVAALRGSLAQDLPPGALFETWAWADRLLGLDLAADVGH